MARRESDSKEMMIYYEDYIRTKLMPELDKELDRYGIPKEKRIGLFGRKRRIDVLCNMIADEVVKAGFTLITGWKIVSEERTWTLDEFLRNVRVDNPVQEIYPPSYRKIPAELVVKHMVCDPHFYMYFVTLCSKAIIDLRELGAQVFEMFGCYLERIPMLGFMELMESEFFFWSQYIREHSRCRYVRVDVHNKVIECCSSGKDCPATKPEDCVFSGYDFWWSARQLFYFPNHKLIASCGIPRKVIIDFIIGHGK